MFRPITVVVAYFLVLSSVYCQISWTTLGLGNLARLGGLTSSGEALHERLSTPNLIRRNGYPVEVHHVTSEDGYILELHRIPYGLKSPKGDGKNPVIVRHGNFQSSADWMLNDPENALPLILADNGFDVWLTNQRGNTYSNRHVNYSFTTPEFWNFSYHESAYYDVPKVIDYVLEQNGNEKLHYVSHSVGSKSFMAALSLRPEYNDKVAVGVMMGPAGFMKYMFNGYAKLLTPLLNQGQYLLDIFGPMPVQPHRVTRIERMLRPMLCRSSVDVAGICSAIFFSIYGLDKEQITQEKLEEIKVIFPSTSSYKLWMHLVQEIGSGHYRQFDYGTDKNLVVYGQPNPPDYDLSKVTVPIAILHGERDHIARIEDTLTLMKVLPNVVDFYVVPWKNWTHLDFDYAKDAGKLNHAHVLKILEQYRF